MSEASSYPDDETMKKSSLERSLRLLAWTQRFGLGTLWWVGETLWGALLPQNGPDAYVRKSDRHEHPGMCVSSSCDSLHATMPMWYGTHSNLKGNKCFVVYLDGREKAPSYFGHFRAVAIDRALFGDCPEARSKKQERAQLRYRENHVVPFERKPRLTDTELSELKRFIKDNISLVGVNYERRS